MCPPNELRLQQLHNIMDEVGEAATTGDKATHAQLSRKRKAEGAPGAGVDEPEDDAHEKRSEQMQNALYTTAKLWVRDKTPWLKADLAAGNHAHARLTIRFRAVCAS